MIKSIERKLLTLPWGTNEIQKKKIMERMRKILFLDFDGVLNSHQFFIQKKEKNIDDSPGSMGPRLCENVDMHCVWNLKYILKQVPELEIVISSSWRNSRPWDYLLDELEGIGVDRKRVIGKTPNAPSREASISKWIEEHASNQRQQYLILDDIYIRSHPLFFAIQIDQRNGLTYTEALQAIKFLNPEWEHPNVLL